ncbi:MAG: hypothetical protein JXA69_20710, partial [Phycisphaerae bacterium]|nr:hypothetical protein [Phycisphaerae bacterium]
MFSRLSRTVLWKYADDAPITTLRRHHRLAARICMLGFGAGAVMVSSAVDLLISPEGWRRTVTLVMLGSTTVISLLMTVPAIIAYAWANEVEKEITARGLP